MNSLLTHKIPAPENFRTSNYIVDNFYENTFN